MCLAQEHNTVPPVRIEPAAPRSRVEHSTTEPLCSFDNDVEKWNAYALNYCVLVNISSSTLVHSFTRGVCVCVCACVRACVCVGEGVLIFILSYVGYDPSPKIS